MQKENVSYPKKIMLFLLCTVFLTLFVNLVHQFVEDISNILLIIIPLIVVAFLTLVLFFIDRNRNQLVGKITKDLEIERNALKKKNEENQSIIQSCMMQNLKLKEIDAQKNEFSSMVTHELRTPLTSILSWSAVLKSQKNFDDDPMRKKGIQKIESNALKLSQLISDILDAEKLELNKISFQKKEFDVESMICDIYENYKNLMEKEAIVFKVSCDQKIVLFSDEDRIAQVLKNLINNAIDFVPKSEGKIDLKVQKISTEVLFSVVDNGIGISTKNQQNLFKKFYQIDNTVTRHHGGSGLGLAICKEIVSRLGGKMGVRSDSGMGSTFYFTLPLK